VDGDADGDAKGAATGTCPACRVSVDLDGLTVEPCPGLAGENIADPVTAALSSPHPMLEPVATRGERRPSRSE
jgi:hypothetical protein